MGMEIGEIWNKLKEGILSVVEEICEKEQLPKKQNWMNSEILQDRQGPPGPFGPGPHYRKGLQQL